MSTKEITEKKNTYTVKGDISKVVFKFNYDDDQKKDTITIVLEKENGKTETVFIGTRVSPLDGAVLMMTQSSEKGLL